MRKPEEELDSVMADIKEGGAMGAGIGSAGGPVGAVVGGAIGAGYARYKREGMKGLLDPLDIGYGDFLGMGGGPGSEGGWKPYQLGTPGLEHPNGGWALDADAYTDTPWINDRMGYNAGRDTALTSNAELAAAEYDRRGFNPLQADLGFSRNAYVNQRQAGDQLFGLGDEFGEVAGADYNSPVAMQLRAEAERVGREQYARAAGASASNRAAAMYQAGNNAAFGQAQANRQAAIQRAQEIQQARANQMAAYGAAGQQYSQAGTGWGAIESGDVQRRQDWAQSMSELGLQSYTDINQLAAQRGMMTDDMARFKAEQQMRQKDAEIDAFFRPDEIRAGIEQSREQAAGQQQSAMLGGLAQLGAAYMSKGGGK